MTANFPEKNLYVSKTGLEFLCHNMHETVQTDVEVFQEQSYIRCGLWLDDDCCVIDVGSNIGFFSLFVADHFRNARIYCAEPAPESLRLLRANLARNGAPAVVWPYAISDRNGTATFKFYPRMAGNSGLYADEVEEARVTSAFLDNVAPGDTAFRDRVLEGKFDDAVSLTCETRTLSELIRSAGVGRIDLLKIDAEKAEHEVIAGIEDTIWEQIDQISMEAHEIGNRVEELCDLLRSRGFTTEVETHKYLEGTGIVQIYASKRELRLDWQLPAGRLLPRNPLARPMQSSETTETAGEFVDQSRIENLLLVVWSELLETSNIDLDDDYFGLGGYSLQVVNMVIRIHEELGVELPITIVFDYPTIRELAHHIESELLEATA